MFPLIQLPHPTPLLDKAKWYQNNYLSLQAKINWKQCKLSNTRKLTWLYNWISYFTTCTSLRWLLFTCRMSTLRSILVKLSGLPPHLTFVNKHIKNLKSIEKQRKYTQECASEVITMRSRYLTLHGLMRWKLEVG